ncbi:MAG: DUF5668 domain-containing protein [Candidatus Aminicenantes bacterium]|nr:DUF5668 domain-containing protein [Candidatus Aminicenantes bacterium]
MTARTRNSGTFIFGLVLVAIGALFLVDNFTYIDVWYYAWRFWPVILILFGLSKILRARARSG